MFDASTLLSHGSLISPPTGLLQTVFPKSSLGWQTESGQGFRRRSDLAGVALGTNAPAKSLAVAPGCIAPKAPAGSWRPRFSGRPGPFSNGTPRGELGHSQNQCAPFRSCSSISSISACNRALAWFLAPSFRINSRYRLIFNLNSSGVCSIPLLCVRWLLISAIEDRKAQAAPAHGMRFQFAALCGATGHAEPQPACR